MSQRYDLEGNEFEISDFGRAVRAKLLEIGHDLSQPVCIGTMEFEGSGDSGYVQELDPALNSISEIAIKYHKEIEEWGNYFVDGNCPGWEINDGSEGEVILSIEGNDLVVRVEMTRWYGSSNDWSGEGEDYPLVIDDDWQKIVDLWKQKRPKDKKSYHIIVSFSGSGDSGCIDNIAIYDRSDNAWTGSPIDDCGLMSEVISDNKTIEKIIEDWSYASLDATGVDWYNNGGGEGEIHILMDEICCEDEGLVREETPEDKDKERFILYEWEITTRFVESYTDGHVENFNLMEEE